MMRSHPCLLLATLFALMAPEARAEFARNMPGFPVKSAIIDEQLGKNPALIGTGQFLLKNISAAKQSGEIAFDNFELQVSIHIANCEGDNEGEGWEECCGKSAAKKQPWIADVQSYNACKKRIGKNGRCDLAPLLTSGDCQNDVGRKIIDTPGGTSKGESPWKYEGRWVQHSDPHYHVFRAAKRFSENDNVRVADAFVWSTRSDGKIALEYKRDRGSRSMTIPFNLGEDSNGTIGRSIFCGFTKTGINCQMGRPASYSSTIPGCRRNASGKIVDLIPCIAKASASLDFDVEVGVKEDRGAIMGSYYGQAHFYGGGEADRDRVNIPLNSGLPF